MPNDASNGRGPSKRWRLRTRLAVGLGVLFVAIFGLIAYSHFQHLNDRRDARVEDMQRVSETIAASFEGLTLDLESFALSTAVTLGDVRLNANEPPSEETRQAVNAYLQHLYDSHGLLRSIFITTTDGIVVYDNDGDSAGLDLSDRTYIQALQAGATEYWSDGFPGSESGRMVLAHSRAIIDSDGNRLGYLVIPLLAESLASRLPAGTVDEGHISIMDGEGTLVLQVPNDDTSLIGSDLGDWPAFSTAVASGSTTVEDETMPLGTADKYGSFIPIENLGWVVGYTRSADAVDGAITDQFYRDMLLLGAIVLAAFVAMWLFANRTVRPLTQLTDMARSISRGQPTETTSLVDSSNAEVVQLADTMAHMSYAIREREEQLRAQNNAMEAIEHFGELLASDLDLERTIRAIIDTGVQLVDADAAQFVLREGAGSAPTIGGTRPEVALAVNDPVFAQVLSGTLVDLGAYEPTHVNGATPGARSVLGIPINGRSSVIGGALILVRGEANAFTAAHRRLATGIARWACIALENAQLYSQSQDLVAELAKANEAKSDFLGIVSHELRTPITTIYGGTLLLRSRRASLPEQAYNDMIVSISEEAERLHHLVADLLAIARTELAVEPRPVVVGDILRNTIGEFATTHRRPVELSVEPDLPPALGDSSYLRQVVSNLITNADKYTPFELPIEVTATRVEAEVQVRVTDHGSGIDAEELPRIFESFYRGKDAGERASGSGLGLTVCRRLIESLGGRIWAQNRPEGGLEVGFTLRVVEDTDEPGTDQSAQPGRLQGPASPEAAAAIADEVVS